MISIENDHRYLWGQFQDDLLADEVVTSTSSAGTIQWALSDQVETVRDIGKWDSTNSEFVIANHRVYNTFGALESETNGSVDLAFGFNGKWTEGETGYTHHLNRWYDAAIGKWLSEDPIGFAAGDTNLTRFVGNKSLTHIDSNGLDETYGQPVPGSTGTGHGDALIKPSFDDMGTLGRKATTPSKDYLSGRNLLRVGYSTALNYEGAKERKDRIGNMAETTFDFIVPGYALFEVAHGETLFNGEDIGVFEGSIRSATFIAAPLIPAGGPVTRQVTKKIAKAPRVGQVLSSAFSRIARAFRRGGCFVPGTLVVMAPQLNAIPSVPTQYVMAYNSEKPSTMSSTHWVIYVSASAVAAAVALGKRRGEKPSHERKSSIRDMRFASLDWDNSADPNRDDWNGCEFSIEGTFESHSGPAFDESKDYDAFSKNGLNQQVNIDANNPTTTTVMGTTLEHKTPRSGPWKARTIGACLVSLAAMLFIVLFGAPESANTSNPIDVGENLQVVRQSVFQPRLQTIESVRLGQRVVTDITDSQARAASEWNGELPWWDTIEIIPEQWREISLHAQKREGGSVEIQLLRPVSWLHENQSTVGEQIHLSVGELGIDGWATVTKIGPCPPIESGIGEVVTGRFAHSEASIIRLSFADIAEDLGVTATHPIYSVDREVFVPAGDLKVDEQVQLRNDVTTVTALDIEPNLQPVFNLEVQYSHVFRVTSGAVLVHNAINCNIPGKKHFFGREGPERAYKHLHEFHGLDPQVASNRLHKLKHAGGLGPNDDAVIGATGDVYNNINGEYLGSLTDKGLGIK